MKNETLANEFFRISQDAFPNGSPWTKPQFLAYLENDTSFFLTVKKKEEIVGFILFSLACEEAEILLLAVSRNKQRCGLGKLLLDKSCEFLRQNNARSYFIEVRRSNQKAWQFYTKYGFEEIAVRKNYYKNPQEDALIGKLSLREVNENGYF